jgi:hypothetical protein
LPELRGFLRNRADEPGPRDTRRLTVRLLPPGGAAFLTSLIGGETLGAAAATAFAQAPSFDLAGSISGMIEAGVFAAIYVGDRQ